VISTGVPIFTRGDDLLERFRRGEKAALDEVYRAYVDAVVRVVSRVLQRQGGAGAWGWRAVAADLPDLVQEVFARAFDPATRQRFDGVRPYGPFIARIAHNVTVDYLRRMGRLVAAEGDERFDQVTTAVPLAATDDGVADPETMEVVNRYLDRLTPDLRQIHDALYVRGMSQREAADALGLGRQSVRTLEARLREGLRHELERAGHLKSSETAHAPTARKAGVR
jgi:RNA polymerase sigma-70 factor (ECF subfamily)